MRVRLRSGRVSDSITLGPFRVRLSVPLRRGRGRAWLGGSVRTPLGRAGVSAPVERSRK